MLLFCLWFSWTTLFRFKAGKVEVVIMNWGMKNWTMKMLFDAEVWVRSNGGQSSAFSLAAVPFVAVAASIAVDIVASLD